MRYRIGIVAIGLLLVVTIVLLLSWARRFSEFPNTRAAVTSTAASTAPPFQANNSITAKKQGSPNVHDQLRRKESVAKIISALATPITFYGRVIDQDGDPVPGATVNYTAVDKFDQSGSKYQGESDANGDFSISGIRGAA